MVDPVSLAIFVGSVFFSKCLRHFFRKPVERIDTDRWGKETVGDSPSDCLASCHGLLRFLGFKLMKKTLKSFVVLRVLGRFV
jgi:hypothetical protein